MTLSDRLIAAPEFSPSGIGGLGKLLCFCFRCAKRFIQTFKHGMNAGIALGLALTKEGENVVELRVNLSVHALAIDHCFLHSTSLGQFTASPLSLHLH
jgi:hypothetical protein